MRKFHRRRGAAALLRLAQELREQAVYLTAEQDRQLGKMTADALGYELSYDETVEEFRRRIQETT